MVSRKDLPASDGGNIDRILLQSDDSDEGGGSDEGSDEEFDF